MSPKSSVTSALPRFTMFTIVGTESSTGKRTFWKRKGSWWSASGWCPEPRRSTHWRLRRRLNPRSKRDNASLAVSSMTMMLTRIDEVLEDMLMEKDKFCFVEDQMRKL